MYSRDRSTKGSRRARAAGININQQLIDQGYGQYREDLGGPEAQAMFGKAGRAFGSLAEALSFQGDSSAINPMRYLGSPALTKLWQERTPLAQYINNEVSGTRMRRWQRPVHDFLMPYARGTLQRLTGQAILPGDVQRRRDQVPPSCPTTKPSRARGPAPSLQS
jgi:hypothetical protein